MSEEHVCACSCLCLNEYLTYNWSVVHLDYSHSFQNRKKTQATSMIIVYMLKILLGKFSTPETRVFSIRSLLKNSEWVKQPP
jgi:hypothetical protein